VSSSEPPRSDPESNVTSLVDRLPPAQRVKLLARIALAPHVSDRVELAQLGEYAMRIEDVDVDAALTELAASTSDLEVVRETRMACRAVRALRSFLRNDPDGARAEWAEIIAEDPERAAPAHFFRSLFWMVRGDLDAALADVNRAVVLSPQDPHAYARRGEIYHHLGSDAEATANFLRAAQIDPDNLVALSGMGVCLQLSGEWLEAIRWYTRAIRLAPGHAQLHFGRALCLEGENRLDEAVTDLDAAIALDPGDPASFHARGRCRVGSDRSLAIADFTRSIELDAGTSAVWTARGRAYLGEGALDEAERDAERALELDPTDTGARFTRAIVHHRRGDSARAAR